MSKVINIGILGAAKIAPRSIIEPAKRLKQFNVFGVTARDMDRAEKFAKTHNIAHVFKDYDSLLASKDIDLVYIPLSNYLHAPWIIKAAEEKKNVLVEKPICLRIEEFNEIKKVMEDKGILLLEGIMIQHHPWQKKIKEIIDAGIYGRLKSIKTHLTFQFNERGNYRFFPENGGGCLL